MIHVNPETGDRCDNCGKPVECDASSDLGWRVWHAFPADDKDCKEPACAPF